MLWVGCGGRGPAAARRLCKADAGRAGVDSGASLSSTSKRLPFLPISSLLFKGLEQAKREDGGDPTTLWTDTGSPLLSVP